MSIWSLPSPSLFAMLHPNQHQTNSYNVPLTWWLAVHAFFKAWQRIAATKYCLYPTSYAHLSKNYVKQYKCSAHRLPAWSVTLFSLTWRFCMSRQKPSQLLRFYKKKNPCCHNCLLNKCLIVFLLLRAKWSPWLEDLLKLQNGFFCNTTVFIFYLTSCITVVCAYICLALGV